MTVENLITYLNKIEDKKQNVYMTSYDFGPRTNVEIAVEIKSSSSLNTHAKGVYLLGDL